MYYCFASGTQQQSHKTLNTSFYINYTWKFIMTGKRGFDTALIVDAKT